MINRYKKRKEFVFVIAVLLVAIALCGMIITGCTGASRTTTPRGWAGGTITGDMLVIASMEGKLVAINISDGSRLWETTLETTEPVSGAFGCSSTASTVAVYGTPVVDGELIFVNGYNGRVYTIDVENRLSNYTYLKKTEKSSSWSVVGGSVVDAGKIYVGSADGCVYALNSIGLDQVWDKPFETEDKIWATPAIDEDTLYIGSFDKNLYAIYTDTGDAKWDEPFKTEGAIVATPALYDNTVLIGSFDKNLYAIDADDGSKKWQFGADNWFWSKPVVYNDVVYAGCLDSKMYILDANTGNKISELELGSPVSSSPVLAGDLVIVAVENGTVYAVDTANNQIKWTKTYLKEEGHKIYAPLCTSGDKVFIHTNKSELHALNTTSGAKYWSISLKSQ